MSDTYITNQPPNQNDAAAWKQAYIDLYALSREATDDYLQALARIAELEAQLAQTWQPLPDGEYSVQTFPSYHLSVQGSDLAAWWSGSYDMEEINVGDYRLCRLVESQPTLTDHEREIIEAMVEDWLQLYEPGSNEWADAQVIVSWLNNYRGTFADDLRQQVTEDRHE